MLECTRRPVQAVRVLHASPPAKLAPPRPCPHLVTPHPRALPPPCCMNFGVLYHVPFPLARVCPPKAAVLPLPQEQSPHTLAPCRPIPWRLIANQEAAQLAISHPLFQTVAFIVGSPISCPQRIRLALPNECSPPLLLLACCCHGVTHRTCPAPLLLFSAGEYRSSSTLPS